MAVEGARAAGKQLLTVRDLRNLRAKVLNSVALHESVSGPLNLEMDAVDRIGVTDGDTRTLITRTLALLYEIAANPALKATMRMRAGRAIADTLTRVKTEQLRARVEEAKVLQRSAETQAMAAVKLAEIEVEERRIEAEHGDAVEKMSLDELQALQAKIDGKPSA